MLNDDLLLLMLGGAFAAGAVFNLRRFDTYVLTTLIAITPFYGTPMMPHEVLGITGLNFWNIVWIIAMTSLAPGFLSSSRSASLPDYFSRAVVVFVVAVAIATVYSMAEIDKFPRFGVGATTLTSLFLTGLVKPLQFMLVGWMVYIQVLRTGDSRPLFRAMLVSIVIFGILVLYYYYVGTATSTASEFDAGYSTYRSGRFKVSDGMGIHVNDVGAWGVYALVISVLARDSSRFWAMCRWLAIVMALVAIVFSFSRTAWLAMPLAAALIFRRIPLKQKVLLGGLFAIIIALTFPLIMERAETGLETRDLNLDHITSGRTTTIWGPLLKDIAKQPVVGHGRFAQLRSILYMKYRTTHAHSLYIQILLDMGVVGLVIVLAVVARMYRVGQKAESMLPHLLLIMLFVGLAGHSFYPDVSNVALWIVYGISLAAVARSKVAMASNVGNPRGALGTLGAIQARRQTLPLSGHGVRALPRSASRDAAT